MIQNPKFIKKISDSIKESLITLSVNIVDILTDLLVFGTCFYNVWETWRLQRNARVRGNGGLVSILLVQSEFMFILEHLLANMHPLVISRFL